MKPKQKPPHFEHAVKTDHSQNTEVPYIVKRVAVCPSKNHDCHPILPDSGDDQVSKRNRSDAGNVEFFWHIYHMGEIIHSKGTLFNAVLYSDNVRF